MNAVDQYATRLAQREEAVVRWERLDERAARLRLSLAGAFLALAAAAGAGLAAVWLILPVVPFAATVLWHQRIRNSCAQARREARFYRDALARMRGSAREGGPTGTQFLDEHHLYGADLDLFGAHGLFQRLCMARTPMGEALIARWLLYPADLPALRERHSAVHDLGARIDFRADLSVLGDRERITLHAGVIERWAAGADELPGRWLPRAAALLVAAFGASAVLWGTTGLAFPCLAVLVVEAALTYVLRDRIQAAVAGMEGAYEDLKLLSTLLRRIEAESFTAGRLTALKHELSSHSRGASATLSQLATVVNFVEARRNPFLAPLMLPLLYNLHAALGAERWRRRHGAAVAAWLSVLGEIEALLSIAGYSVERPEDPFPVFRDGPAAFVASALGHPLLPPGVCVRNDVAVSGDMRVLLVSGSNMSGKSTLLRAVGLNAVLAMAGAPVCAARLELTPLQVGASIRVNDSLYEGSSRFYAEITRLRRLFEPLPLPLLFLLDELLQGTNSTDRRIGAQGVIRALLARGSIGLVSTHDLALADGEFADGALCNVHFEDEIRDGRLRFDFKLRRGTVTSSNGVELMRAIGLEV